MTAGAGENDRAVAEVQQAAANDEGLIAAMTGELNLPVSQFRGFGLGHGSHNSLM
jgi:hypothetical protein